ncbi:hypothetical protein CBER1_11206 [Cercospora berteroae]|uniref:NAD(P)-binding protein n=1 Tax=Cercospora berteroae TaxID=357750 RepID=A0A2S6CMC5_9PEZI|nr:hypothetical protein CBER1_11206 [Cercospora berteroae]
MAAIEIDEKILAPLRNQVVVITGGSSGIGLATARTLLDLGALVCIGDLHATSLVHSNLTFTKTNVTSWRDLARLFSEAASRAGRIDHVFANAGMLESRVDHLKTSFSADGELEEPSTELYDVNLRGMINTCHLGLHYMQQQEPRGGSIVCMGSAASIQRYAAWDYTATKHAVLGWMRAAIPNIEVHQLPIRVNCVGPSWTLNRTVSPEWITRAGLESQSPEAVARVVALLMADVTRQGQFIYIAGGQSFEVEEALMLPQVETIKRLGTMKPNPNDVELARLIRM